jgi:hypothetical protein
MFAAFTVLAFTAAAVVAFGAIYATVHPAMAKIRAALSGTGTAMELPPLPPRRVAVMRVTVRPAMARPAPAWRAAA